MNTKVSLIGAPTDIGAGTRGSSMGPEALRVADIGPVLERHGLEVVDRGNLSGQPNPWRPPVVRTASGSVLNDLFAFFPDLPRPPRPRARVRKSGGAVRRRRVR